MPLQLYFPNGVPEGYRRIIDSDETTRALIKGLVAMHSNLKNLAGKAYHEVHDIGWIKRLINMSVPESDALHGLLFKPELWPAMSKHDRTALIFLKRLVQLSHFNHRPIFSPDEELSQKEVNAGVEYLIKQSGALFDKAYDEYRDMLDRVSEDVRNICQGSGEECSREDAVGIANADLYAMWEIDRFPGITPHMKAYLKAFLDHLDS